MSKSYYFFEQQPEHSSGDAFEGKFVCENPPGNDMTTGETPVPLKRFAGQYWFAELPGGKHMALSTEEIAASLGDRTIRSISGPFSSRDEASQSLERYWEMLMDKEEE